MELRITDIRCIAIFCVCILCATACYYDVEEKIYPKDCNTENVTYSGTIEPILARECYSCHDALSRDGDVNVEGYDEVIYWVSTGELLASIRHEGAYPMPEGREKLDTCTIMKIEAWIAAGAPNN